MTRGQTAGTDATAIAADQLRSIIERIENLEASIKALNDDKSEVYGEAKANGYSVKVLKRIVADRRKDPDDLSEFETLLALYQRAIGDGLPVHAREAA